MQGGGRWLPPNFYPSVCKFKFFMYICGNILNINRLERDIK
jgi:hypothetical protein